MSGIENILGGFDHCDFGTVQTVARKHKVGTVPVKVLDGVSGVLRPGRLTLLMGPPGAGKSVFMKARPAALHDLTLTQLCQQ